MRFNLTAPCKHCPFRKDCLKGWLGRERAQGIADDLQWGKSFACHETTTHDEDGEATIRTEEESACAGSLHLTQRGPFGNAMYQIAERLGLYDPSKLKKGDKIFDSYEDFVNHHDHEGK